jgi:uncharacterized protein YjbJ (UPF0337 family)
MAGKMDKAKGKAKEAVGHAVGNRRLEREGKRDQAIGELKDKVHKARREAERSVDETLHHPEDYEDERP